VRRADRLFKLVELLRSRRFATAEQLAADLEVSKRTIYRDIRDLELSGVPIRGEAGVGYQLERGYELPPLTFTAAEIEALVLGVRMVESWGDPDLASSARSAMARIAAGLPPALRTLLIETPLFAPGYRRAPEHLAPWRRAINGRRKVRVDYVDARGEQTDRILRPLALYFWGKTWTVGAWCELRSAYRNFRTDRVDGVAAIDETFDGRDGVDLQGYLKRMREEAAAAGWPALTDPPPGQG
jgi:predicted DNA-binding transcriptional regulator YafY